MRDDVLKQVAQLKEITNAIVLTHNIDFIFLQSVFMTALKQCGHPNLTIFADAQCAQQTYRYQSRLLSGLGRRFRVVPVAMPVGFRFHPKAILLSGPEQATLFVGSGNLTFGGMRENAEVWTRFETANDEGGAFSAFRGYLADIQKYIALPEAVLADTNAAFEVQNHTWVETLPEPNLLYGRTGDGDPLLDRVLNDFGATVVSRLVVCTPYFDVKASALVEMSARLGNPPTQVLVQDRRSTLFKEAAEKLPPHITLSTVSYRRKKGDDNSGSRFIHAKFFAFQQGGQITVYSGSANCSIAALLLAGERGNSELLAKRVLSEEEYENQFTGEFDFDEGPPELMSQDDLPEASDEEIPAIRLMAARFDAGELLIGFHAPSDVRLTKCIAGDLSLDIRILNNNEAVVHMVLPPEKIYLEGNRDGQTIISNVHWVDDEDQLRSTARGRTLIESIQRSQRSGGWHMDDWSMIVGLLVKDMNYVSPNAMMRKQNTDGEEGSDRKWTFSYSDVFSNNYNATPTLSSDHIQQIGRSSFSIHKLLLNAFGIDTHHGQQPDDEPDDGEQQKLRSLVTPLNNEDEVVDAPEDLGKKKNLRPEREVTMRDRKRISQLIDAITQTLTNPVYLETRDPKKLGVDLQVIALLLRKAYSKGWVSSEQFFDFTQKVLSELFFNSDIEKGIGWLEYRYLHSESPDKFISDISSPSLSAALFAWVDAMPVTAVGPYLARFMVAQCLSMGRLQWLWHNNEEDQGDVLQKIVSIIEDSPCATSSQYNNKDNIHMHRIGLLRMGAALRQLEDHVGSVQVDEIRSRVSAYPIHKGELLWQGRRGVCIALQEASGVKDFLPVLCLQDPEGESKFRKDYLIPIRALLTPGVLPESTSIGTPQQEALSDFLDQVEMISGVSTS